MSRSAFSARFTELVGQPPMQYLTTWRMVKATELLRESQLGLRAVATLVGYESGRCLKCNELRKHWN